GLLASAAVMLAVSCSIEPSVWVNTIWQLAWILAQASSKPFFTACQNGLEADEWCVKTMFIGAAAAIVAEPPSMAAATATDISSCFMILSSAVVACPLVHTSDALVTRRSTLNARSNSGLSSRPSPGPGGTVIMPLATGGSAVTRSRYQVR